MNRREMLGATVALATGVNITAQEKESNFKPIDNRLEGKIYLSDLQDGESGYISSGCIMLSKQDSIFYFALGYETGHMSVWNDTRHFGGYYVWVGKKGGKIYVKLPENIMQEALKWKDNPKQDQYLQRPAQLAYNCAYPLEDKEGEYYVIPASWNECAKHKKVQNNILLLASAIEMMNQLRDLHGIHAELCRWDHDKTRLKKALEPVAHLGIPKHLGLE